VTRRIAITVSPNGSIVAEAFGVSGEACLGELETITSLLPWATIVDSRVTAGYFGSASTAVTATELNEPNHDWGQA
jgi:hypothetical protein